MSRNSSISHPNYTHHSLDLSDLEAVKAYEFSVPEDATRIVLINNAGRVGGISPVGKLDDNDVISTYNVNLISPSILCNHFVEAFAGHAMEKLILNISSGAGKSAIGSWGAYCATKAGLDLFSSVINVEQGVGVEHPVKVLSVAPGIVDTDMQVEIRSSNAADFSRHADFIEYKKSGQLASSELTAAKYLYILNNLQDFPETLYSVRDLS